MNKRGIVVAPNAVDKRELAKAMRRKMTPAESILWTKLRRSACAGVHFRRQQIIDGFIVDFYCHSVGLIIEVDGGVHEQHAEYDKVRENILVARGLTVVRFTNERVLTDIEGVLKEIKTAVSHADFVTPFPASEASVLGKGAGGLGKKREYDSPRSEAGSEI